MFKAKLFRKPLGWTIVPLNQESSQAVATLYGEKDYKQLTEEDLCFSQDSIDKVKDNIKQVAKDIGMSLSFCGKPEAPTMSIWWKQAIKQSFDEVSVDLKWAIWSEDKFHWDEYAPGIWERAEAAFNGTGNPIKIISGPRKEIRFGYVAISKGQARGEFATEWDDTQSLADTLNTEHDDAFVESIPFTMMNCEPGCEWDFKVKARKFANLMKRIDLEERNLTVHDQREWDFIKSMYSKKPENELWLEDGF